MDVRDRDLVDAVAARPFGGYAERPALVQGGLSERVAALVALLVTMVVSGILLGSPRDAQDSRGRLTGRAARTAITHR